MTDLEPIPDSALKRLGGELAQLLDDDQWNNTEKRYLLPALEEQEAIRSRAEAAEAEVLRLLNALKYYGVHTDECYSQEGGPDTCDCGFDFATEQP